MKTWLSQLQSLNTSTASGVSTPSRVSQVGARERFIPSLACDHVSTWDFLSGYQRIESKIEKATKFFERRQEEVIRSMAPYQSCFSIFL